MITKLYIWLIISRYTARVKLDINLKSGYIGLRFKHFATLQLFKIIFLRTVKYEQNVFIYIRNIQEKYEIVNNYLL